MTAPAAAPITARATRPGHYCGRSVFDCSVFAVLATVDPVRRVVLEPLTTLRVVFWTKAGLSACASPDRQNAKEGRAHDESGSNAGGSGHGAAGSGSEAARLRKWVKRAIADLPADAL